MFFSVALSLGTKEGLAVAALMIGLNLYKDNTESKPVQLYNSPDSVIIFSKGRYFCPFYCKVQHAHRAHDASYQCGFDACSHFKIHTVQDSLIFKVKKSCTVNKNSCKLLTDTLHVSSTLIGRADK